MKIRIEECVNPSFLTLKIFNAEPMKTSFFDEEIVGKFISVEGVNALSLRPNDEILIELKGRDYNVSSLRTTLIEKFTEIFDRVIDFEYKEVSITDYL